MGLTLILKDQKIIIKENEYNFGNANGIRIALLCQLLNLLNCKSLLKLGIKGGLKLQVLAQYFREKFIEYFRLEANIDFLFVVIKIGNF